MGILNPIDGCMSIPFYEKKEKHVSTTAHMFANMKVNGKDDIPYIMEK